MESEESTVDEFSKIAKELEEDKELVQLYKPGSWASLEVSCL